VLSLANLVVRLRPFKGSDLIPVALVAGVSSPKVRYLNRMTKIFLPVPAGKTRPTEDKYGLAGATGSSWVRNVMIDSR
jgi:hypothetical protein